MSGDAEARIASLNEELAELDDEMRQLEERRRIEVAATGELEASPAFDSREQEHAAEEHQRHEDARHAAEAREVEIRARVAAIREELDSLRG